MNLFNSALLKQNNSRPPVWLMRQAGRYHAHYQSMRKNHSFIDLCKTPTLAAEVAMGPVDDFGFDAAILFSDILFPLEAMGMGLRFEEGPHLDWHLRNPQDLDQLKSGSHLARDYLSFQKEALCLTRKKLPLEKGLIGFVGGPFTLYCYAVEGRHQGDLASAREGMMDGRWPGFFEKLMDLLVENMALQVEGGADSIAVLDTCAGELTSDIYRELVVPSLATLFQKFKTRFPSFPLVYYSRGTNPNYWEHLKNLPISGLGIDWRNDIAEVLLTYGDRWAIQGNVDPQWLFLSSSELEARLVKVFEKVADLPAEKRKGWICGLGHGVLPKTPEQNIRLFLSLQKKFFGKSNH